MRKNMREGLLEVLYFVFWLPAFSFQTWNHWSALSESERGRRVGASISAWGILAITVLLFKAGEGSVQGMLGAMAFIHYVLAASIGHGNRGQQR